MRIAAIIFYLLSVAPIRIGLLAYTADHTLPFGSVLFQVYGVHFQIQYAVIRDAQERICIRLGRKKLPVRVPSRRRKHFTILRIPRVKRILHSWIDTIWLDAHALIGTGDAADTALICGLIRSLGAMLPHACLRFEPQYRRACFAATLSCITTFRLGKLFLTLFLIGSALLRQSISGGAGNGNHQGAKNKRCDENRA